ARSKPRPGRGQATGLAPQGARGRRSGVVADAARRLEPARADLHGNPGRRSRVSCRPVVVAARAAAGAELPGCGAARGVLPGRPRTSESAAGRDGRGTEQRSASVREHVDTRRRGGRACQRGTGRGASRERRLFVRSATVPPPSAPAVARPIYARDPSQPATDGNPLDASLRALAVSTPRCNLAPLSVFAAIGLALTIVAIYGVMSTVVAQQR